jgi:hypothetical protein
MHSSPVASDVVLMTAVTPFSCYDHHLPAEGLQRAPRPAAGGKLAATPARLTVTGNVGLATYSYILHTPAYISMYNNGGERM